MPPIGRSRKTGSLKLLALIISLSLAGCASFGPKKLPADNSHYTDAIGLVLKRQMLANLVRLRYMDAPVFLSVSSILTQYSFGGEAGISVTDASNGAPNLITGTGGLSYIEKPTITFSPLAGHEFSRQLMRPVPAEFMFAAAQAGWPVDLLMRIGMQQINDVKNMSFSQVPSPGLIDPERQYEEEFDRLENFNHLVDLLLVAGTKGLVEMQQLEGSNGDQVPVLLIGTGKNEKERTLTREIRDSLGLSDDISKFRVTTRQSYRAEDEITLKMRGLLGMMSFLSRGVMVPEAHKDEVLDIAGIDTTSLTEDLIPLKVHASTSRPENPFVSIRHRDRWFYIDNTDTLSKRTLLILMTLFQLQAPDTTGAKPLLTLPAG